jgi:hypothetical protein
MSKFPENFGTELSGKDFSQVFETCPKWVECVRETWTDNCTGLFLEFQQFITLRLADIVSRTEHETRCREYVKTLKPEKVPEYLLKYTKNASQRGTTELSLA